MNIRIPMRIHKGNVACPRFSFSKVIRITMRIPEDTITHLRFSLSKVILSSSFLLLRSSHILTRRAWPCNIAMQLLSSLEWDRPHKVVCRSRHLRPEGWIRPLAFYCVSNSLWPSYHHSALWHLTWCPLSAFASSGHHKYQSFLTIFAP